MLEIEIMLLTVFYSQMDKQTEYMNQELEQYLWFFVDYRQKNWPKWLVSTKFIVNSNTHLATKVSPFITSYGRKLRMEANIRRKKIEKMTKFAKEMKKSRKKQK